MGTADLLHRGDYLTVTTGSGGVERDGVEGRLDLLQTSLSTRPLVTGRGEVRPGGQLGKGDGADGGLVGECRCDGGVIPLDDHGGVEQAGGHLQTLRDDPIEVGPELAEVNMRAGSAESDEVRPPDESPSGWRNWTELGHRNAIARHDEGLSGGHRVDHPGIVVAQLPLRDLLGHAWIVALRATVSYSAASRAPRLVLARQASSNTRDHGPRENSFPETRGVAGRS
jgi:hypothetical protein